MAAPTPTPAAPAGGAASVATAETDLGTILVDANGMTLYGFTADTAGEPTCVDGCADTWPPTLVEGEPEVGDLDASVFTVVEHPLGSQLKAGDWPLYTFSGDTASGDTNGQGSGGKWFVVAVDGSLIESSDPASRARSVTAYCAAAILGDWSNATKRRQNRNPGGSGSIP